MEKGILYWITGLAGSGKTTIGNMLYYEIKKKKSNTVILDGDILKNISKEISGYSYEDRKKRARVYSNICKMLVDQGINVVICTIAMFDEIREWNRNNIDKYIEVFLDVDIEVLLKRNKKGLYSDNKSNVVGIDVEVEFPKNPDIIINNDGRYSVKECMDIILNYQYREASIINNIDYWNGFYEKSFNTIVDPTSFAKYIMSYITPNKILLDLGCGNGRDSKFFINNNLNVVGVDSSDYVINKLNNEIVDSNSLFICDDFVSSKNIFQQQYDYIYSRFTLYTINEKQETELLLNVKESLKDNGYFFIEARTINDDIYGKGKKIGDNEYIYNNHYRRFINVDKFKEKVLHLGGFDIVELEEAKGYAKLADSNPTLMRCILKRDNS
ncbi:adenylyl-sulfate kinase [Clostridium sp. MSJ-8]|uniref:adenylyl-sulfate kinase n=1 Tax=Clostridium sp. MSJ-8 TaxID=2841510 RepID=UPI001C0ED867|nr:adenylyl-sulfate kinase [Clostridium sp. MSJ-8]MBU5488413.1 adenylyl-sulfate kinase [Clostridium sp. MSJ-8]